MHTLRDSAEVLNWEHFQGTRNQLATELAACKFLGIGEHLLPRPGDTPSVVIKLNVGSEKAGVLLKLIGRAALIERVERSGIKCRYSFKQRVRRLAGFGARG